MASTKTVVLKSSDGETFEVSESATLLSKVIKNDDSVAVSNVNGRILAKVVEYCEKHAKSVDGEGKDVDFKAFDAEFLKVENNTLVDLLMAAFDLEIRSLLDLTCQKVADIMKDMSVEDIRKLLNVENDYTPEEEAEIRKAHHWAFE